MAVLIDIAIFVTGTLAIWLSQQNNDDLKKYACLFGLLGQPLWIYSTWMAESWGMFAMTLVYTYIWIMGLKNNWEELCDAFNSRKLRAAQNEL